MKSKTQLVYYLLIVLLIKRHVSAYSEAIIRLNLLNLMMASEYAETFRLINNTIKR